MGEHMDAAMRRRLDLTVRGTFTFAAAGEIYGAIRYDGDPMVHMATSLVTMTTCALGVIGTAYVITLITNYGLKAKIISVLAAVAWALLATTLGVWGNAFTALLGVFMGPLIFLLGTKYVFAGYVCEVGSKPWRQTGWSDGRPLEGS